MGVLALALGVLLASPTWRLVGDDGKPFTLRAPVVDLTPQQLVETAVRTSRPDLFLPPPRVVQSEGIPPVQGIPMNDTVTNVLLFTGGAALLTSIVLDWVHHK